MKARGISLAAIIVAITGNIYASSLFTRQELPLNAQPSVFLDTIRASNLDINSTNESGESLLMVCIEAGRTDLVELLVEKGADLTWRIHDRAEASTALSYAIRFGNYAIFSNLVAIGAGVRETLYREICFLTNVFMERRYNKDAGDYEDVYEEKTVYDRIKMDLLEYTLSLMEYDPSIDLIRIAYFLTAADPDAMMFDYRSISNRFAGDMRLRYLDALKADVRDCDRLLADGGFSGRLLRIALVCGKKTVFRYLLDNGKVGKDVLNSELLNMSYQGDADSVAALVTNGADINLENGLLLQNAISRNDTNLIHFLIKNGCDYRKADVIRVALSQNDLEPLRILAGKGLDQNLRMERLTILEYAYYFSAPETILFLETNGMKGSLNAAYMEGGGIYPNPLFYAVVNGHIKKAGFFLEKKVPLDARLKATNDSVSLGIMDCAYLYSGKPEMVRLLRAAGVKGNPNSVFYYKYGGKVSVISPITYNISKRNAGMLMEMACDGIDYSKEFAYMPDNGSQDGAGGITMKGSALLLFLEYNRFNISQSDVLSNLQCFADRGATLKGSLTIKSGNLDLRIPGWFYYFFVLSRLSTDIHFAEQSNVIMPLLEKIETGMYWKERFRFRGSLTGYGNHVSDLIADGVVLDLPPLHYLLLDYIGRPENNEMVTMILKRKGWDFNARGTFGGENLTVLGVVRYLSSRGAIGNGMDQMLIDLLKKKGAK